METNERTPILPQTRKRLGSCSVLNIKGLPRELVVYLVRLRINSTSLESLLEFRTARLESSLRDIILDETRELRNIKKRFGKRFLCFGAMSHSKVHIG